MNKENLSSGQSQSSVSIVAFKSQTSLPNKARTEKMKNCCRIFVELMFTQVIILSETDADTTNTRYDIGWCWMSVNMLHHRWSVCISIFGNTGTT